MGEQEGVCCLDVDPSMYSWDVRADVIFARLKAGELVSAWRLSEDGKAMVKIPPWWLDDVVEGLE